MSANYNMWVISGFLFLLAGFPLDYTSPFFASSLGSRVLCSLNIMYLLFSLVSSHTDSQLFCSCLLRTRLLLANAPILCVVVLEITPNPERMCSFPSDHSPKPPDLRAINGSHVVTSFVGWEDTSSLPLWSETEF